jgi:hypothetical protein
MTHYRKCLRVASIVLGVVTSTAATSTLAAQGGAKARRPAAAAPTNLEPARGILRNLVGRWRVEIRFAGNFDGAPDASGTRVVDSLFDNLRLQWTEELDSSRVKSQGMIGVDSRTGQFYSTAVDSTGSGVEFLTGTLDLAEPLITFGPAAPSANVSFILRMIDADHFTWAPLDRGWRAVLTREQ